MKILVSRIFERKPQLFKDIVEDNKLKTYYDSSNSAAVKYQSTPKKSNLRRKGQIKGFYSQM